MTQFGEISTAKCDCNLQFQAIQRDFRAPHACARRWA